MDLSTYSYRYVYICYLYFGAFSFRSFLNRFPYFLFIFGLLNINISAIFLNVLTMFKSIFILPSISNFLFCFVLHSRKIFLKFHVFHFMDKLLLSLKRVLKLFFFESYPCLLLLIQMNNYI